MSFSADRDDDNDDYYNGDDGDFDDGEFHDGYFDDGDFDDDGDEGDDDGDCCDQCFQHYQHHYLLLHRRMGVNLIIPPSGTGWSTIIYSYHSTFDSISGELAP